MESNLCIDHKENICKAYPNACLRCGKGKYSEGIPAMSGRYPGLFKEIYNELDCLINDIDKNINITDKDFSIKE